MINKILFILLFSSSSLLALSLDEITMKESNISIAMLKKCFCDIKKELPPPDPLDPCKLKSQPTKEELKMAKIAWKYIENNYNEDNGLINAANNYSSASIWDWANGVYGIFAARKFNIITQDKYEKMMNSFLTTMQEIKLFNNELPNKTYNTKSTKMTNYGNDEVEDGIGWSVADIARLLASLNVVYQCEYNLRPAIEKLTTRYRYCRAINVYGDLYGSSFHDGELSIHKETMTGYEEYLARGVELWGHNADEARRYKFLKEVPIYGVNVPTDTRTFYSAFVGSESYWNTAFDYGVDDNESGQYIYNIYKVQEERYNHTGQFTAVTEDNIDRKPYFLYNSIYTNGEPWKIINHDAQDYNDFKSVSSKAGLAMKYIFDTPYANSLFNYLKNNYDSEKGYYAGIYETMAGQNKALTLNTNSLILETLLFDKLGALQEINEIKKRGTYDFYRNRINNFKCLPTENNMTILEPFSPTTLQDLNSTDINNSRIAWKYFENNYHPESGFVNSSDNYKTINVKDIGRTIMATISAKALGIIDAKIFKERMGKLLETLSKLKLYNEELPSNAYDALTGESLPQSEDGWNLYDIAHLLTGLYYLQRDYPLYQEKVFGIVSAYDFSRAIEKKNLKNCFYYGPDKEYLKDVLDPAQEYYIHNALKLFNFKSYSHFVDEKNLEYKAIYNYEVPMGYNYQIANAETYLWSMLEHPYYLKYKHYSSNIYLTLKDRYTITGKLSTSSQEHLDGDPYTIYNDIHNEKRNWSDFDKWKNNLSHLKTISTKASFIYDALYGYTDTYTKLLIQNTHTLYNEDYGWYGGYYSDKERINKSVDLITNSAVLESLYYKKVGNLYYHQKETLKERIALHHIHEDNLYSLENKEDEFFYKQEDILNRFDDNDTTILRIERKGDNFVIRAGAFATQEEAQAYLLANSHRFKDFTIVNVNVYDENFLLANRYYRYDYRLPYENKIIDETTPLFDAFYEKYQKEKTRLKEEREAKEKLEKEAEEAKEKLAKEEEEKIKNTVEEKKN